jgi:hypothetical protein
MVIQYEVAITAVLDGTLVLDDADTDKASISFDAPI